MISTELVARNFSRVPETYDTEAGFQRHAAVKLAEFIRLSLNFDQPPRKILEFGCGTGFLTLELMKLFPKADYLITDISEKMLRLCEKNSAKLRQDKVISADFTICDVTAELPGGDFDLIVSGLTFQWVPDFPVVAQRIFDYLPAKGQLIFSTLSNRTFHRLKHSFQALNIPYPGPELLTEEAICQCCTIFDECIFERESYHKEFSSTRDFFQHLQRTGAGNATGENLTVAQLRELLRHHDKSGKDPETGMIIADYHAAYTLCRKD